MKTYQPKQKEIKRDWHLVDAKDQVLGRLSTKVATLLMGKQKTTYSAHMDSGDFVVIINAEKIITTGKKSLNKVYRSHSGYPGGFKEVTFEKMSKEHPNRIIEFSVNGMLPDNRLKADRMARLFVFKGEKHKYESKFK
ncbi:50S ribosomal protein L13 [Candidatus Woesebacteria bacterium GWC2_33_12]|uniref:Large ribosomal subunit protein uL13 n=1 Tax=Candidatus Woesebacteria bacterium GW2011_GWB1_33_22 TaxID=1618566 RepID=A0A0G0A124_9BACT|nr:MAG: 50S ribosomal protein L13 [Candidatus Woesebacteria bacterium GW2011_GWC2_33_12]KKP42162.1 MAG: 50S ribosomal protein L13 [Candidatus Woesebacteria bacterium GW2011_GWA2_33_20]KKP44896.1 MAG: 50S ribosomal protein L13 [Candidatus Woesebacteria bacterium GW2011_GWB1_33_22]KKP46710.1 MAG: 50S ribosomal protein L13 [Microgenomates group bacterium GW2011_GWC1_33_28]KKP50610.1 MAG: 50S ribosomal protein L13 [Candidatus Woesebacteria bacterium GW2011_GWA1_33_33]OGM07755.1 MAG: 50S ribosomal 